LIKMKGTPMITLYRVPECHACDEVQETLKELVVAHQVVNVQQERPAALADKELPVIEDGEQWVSGEAALNDYLEELTRVTDQWRKFQTDACYIDDKGKSC
jgi:glutaredoxin